ncbi:MAG TPA: ABC transporter substrate-binding protein [Jiangellaceae bacterium]
MRVSTPFKLAASVAAVALLATACGGDDDDGGDAADQGEEPVVAEGGTLRIYSSEPAFLIPTAGDDQPSILVIRQLFSGLVDYNEEGQPVLDLAESIESEDNKTWTITVKDGYTFHNGEPVDADAFMRAWNYAADGDNAQNNAYFMSRIVGIDEAQESGTDELSGVTKIDDMTFEVELKEPFVGFEAMVGYSGFFPVAEECLADFDACNETPIGNGPYQIEGEWQHNVGITLTRFEDYPDDGKSNPDVLDYQIFSDVDAAYAAFQAGEIDVMYTVPPARIAEVTQLENHLQLAGDGFTYVGLPLYLPEFEDERVRQALSLAIDRQPIIDAVFDGTRTPSTGLVSPNFDGYREGVCEFCNFDPERAQQLLEEAGGWQGDTLKLEANAGAGHEDWLQAVGDQLRENLGIEYELAVNLDFPEYLARSDAGEFEGAFRLGWGPDYPVMETYLAPLYGTGGSSNNARYDNPDFDAKIREADSAESLEEAIPLYQEAEDMVLADMPVIPMWWADEIAVWSENVETFVWNPINEPEYGQMVVASE